MFVVPGKFDTCYWDNAKIDKENERKKIEILYKIEISEFILNDLHVSSDRNEIKSLN